MLQRNKGHVVTIASAAGLIGVNGLVDYCTSKFADVGFDESLRQEIAVMGKDGVKTTCICPFYINTGMFTGVKTRWVCWNLKENLNDLHYFTAFSSFTGFPPSCQLSNQSMLWIRLWMPFWPMSPFSLFHGSCMFCLPLKSKNSSLSCALSRLGFKYPQLSFIELISLLLQHPACEVHYIAESFLWS